MLVVGLTGGIASGKTTVSSLFSDKGIVVIDADVIGRKMLDPGQPGYQQVVEDLGDSILNSDNSINRQRLRQAVFSRPELKNWLEEMLHPLIYQACQQEIAESGQPAYLLLVVPLMFETDFYQLVERFCVIDCPAEIQLDRLMQRDGVTRELAEKMINSQMDNETRLARADDIITNSGSFEDLVEQVCSLHEHYTALATN